MNLPDSTAFFCLPHRLPHGGLITRYPKAGKGKKWTTLELKAMPPAWRGDTLSDGDRLIGEVRVANDQSVSARFKFAFRWDSKIAWYPCGTWPNVSMAAALLREQTLSDEARIGYFEHGHRQNDLSWLVVPT